MKEITEEEFAEFAEEQKSFVVDFYAEWCGPCKALIPALEELDEVLVVKMNIEKSPGAVQKFSIRSVPTLIVFDQGTAVFSTSSITELKKKLAEII